jgi:hypothetical protein
MPDISPLVDQITQLCAYAARIDEESFRLIIEGDRLDAQVVNHFIQIRQLIGDLNCNAPTIFAADESLGDDDLAAPDAYLGDPWRLVLGKTSIAEKFRVREVETTVFFFSVHRFDSWLKELDPFVISSEHDPRFSEPVTIFVAGLDRPFGGPLLWILPITDYTLPEIPPTHLPDSSAVHSLIHINSDRLMSVCPKGWALNWGDLDQLAAKQICHLSAMVLSACLVQELKRYENQITATIRGTKLISSSLPAKANEEVVTLLPLLVDAIEWVYSERTETRLKLVTDRLSIDIQPDHNLLVGMQLFLAEALKQARDSYAFVILERKDAYHKEMRELMKDMKSQADLYAAKVRDLVSSLTRDILGVLVFLAFSFIGKFDHAHIKELLSSGELSLLMKFMAGYLVLSFSLQLVTHLRDANLSYKESEKWLSILQNYTSRAENEERFTNPLDKRKTTLYWAMAIIGILYTAAAFFVWNMPFVTQLLLAQK